MKYLSLILNIIKFFATLVILLLNAILKKNFKGKRAFRRTLNNYAMDKDVINQLTKEYLNLAPENLYTQYGNRVLKK